MLLGDVVICPAVASEAAPTHAGTLDDELALLVVHGILHVLGHDHAEPGETRVMREPERALLEQHHWHGPAPAAFTQEQRRVSGDHELGDCDAVAIILMLLLLMVLAAAETALNRTSR